MKKYFIYSVSALAIASSLASCANEDEFGPAGAQRVELNVTANRGGDALSRTAFENVDGNLLCTWDEDDQLVAFNAAGTNLGVLTIKAETLNNAKTTATFSGNVTIADGETVRLYYVGNGATGLESLTSEGAIALGTQLGTIEDLAANDFLSSQAAVEFRGGKAVATVEMKREVAEGYFQLTMPEGVTLTAEDFVTISAESGILPVEATVNYSTATVTPATTTGEIKVNIAGEAANSFYVTMLPCNVAPKFVVVKGNKTYTATLTAHDWTAGSFVRANSNGDPVNVSDWTVETAPVNPGDTGNWAGAGDATDPTYIDNGVTFVNQNGMGWCLNWSSVYEYGGWGTYITYPSNGIINGYMTSKGGTGIYFQWGRWMGLPSTCGYLIINSAGSYSGGYKAQSQLPLGVNYYNTHIGYCFANSLSGAHGKVYMGNTDWTRERVKNASIMFGMVNSMIEHGDYIGANEVCKWEDRSGNPAPKGYRIPTAAELGALIPSNSIVNGTKAEVKTINGKKFAYKWTVNNSGSVPSLEIRSFETSKSTVSESDTNFDSAPVIRLLAYGYLNNLGEQTGYGELGVFWSSDSGEVDGGNGGIYLEVAFDGNTATMELASLWRSFGGLVLLIKDDSATPDALTPLFPLTGI